MPCWCQSSADTAPSSAEATCIGVSGSRNVTASASAGCQMGLNSLQSSRSTKRVNPVPSALIRYKPLPPVRLDVKTSMVPSGDQVGLLSSAGSVVNRLTLDPSALATKISILDCSTPSTTSGTAASKANRPPSGDHTTSLAVYRGTLGISARLV